MLTDKDIIKILKCSRSSVAAKMLKLGIKKHVQPFAHGKKNIYYVTEDRLRELIAQQKSPEEIAKQQMAALGSLEAVFVRRQHIGQ